MLTFLSIQNYLTVDSLTLSFKNGMTAITGETGAGKSVLIGALTTSLGSPASADLISKGKDKFDITTIFDIKTLPNLQEYLKSRRYESYPIRITRRKFHEQVPVPWDLFGNRPGAWSIETGGAAGRAQGKPEDPEPDHR